MKLGYHAAGIEQLILSWTCSSQMHIQQTCVSFLGNKQRGKLGVLLVKQSQIFGNVSEC